MVNRPPVPLLLFILSALTRRESFNGPSEMPQDQLVCGLASYLPPQPPPQDPPRHPPMDECTFAKVERLNRKQKQKKQQKKTKRHVHEHTN